jgi:DNA-directed RNA polymerase subunit RPC12/RpoP
MNVLQLFKLDKVAEIDKKPVTVPRKRKNSIDKLSSGVSADYHCANCKKNIKLETSELVQCYHCNHRIVNKTREKKGIQYNAV